MEQLTDLCARLPGALLPWFTRSARDLPWRADREPYHVWLSEIMLQQTRVEAVRNYYTRFLAALPDVSALAEADDALLQKLWEGLGYYTRMRNLKKCAQVIVKEHGGRFPRTPDALRALPGIGEYTAGAICSICFDLPEPAVDGNVLRVISRVCAIDEPVDAPAVRRAITQALRDIYPAGRCGDFTQALMELGATVCVPNGAPRCALCPAAAFCRARESGTAALLPVKRPKKARREEHHTVLIARCGERIALRKRPETGLLAGLLELPNLPGTLTAQQALGHALTLGLSPVQLTRQTDKTHIFTHITWKMRGYHIICDHAAPGFLWLTPEEAALPSAFRIFLEEPL